MTAREFSAPGLEFWNGDEVHPIPLVLMCFGASFVALSLGVLLWFRGPDGLGSADGLVGVGITSAFALGVVAGGYWLDRSSIDPDRYGRVAVWTISGSAVILLVNLPMIVAFPLPDFGGRVGWTVNAACMGAGVGILLGIVEARSIERALRAQRASLRAENAETQLEWLDYLNSLLRHEILNNVTVIEGYTEELLATHEDDPQTRSRLETVRNRTRDMAEVITDVRVLLQATNGVDTLEAIDLGDVVETEVADLRELHPDVEVEVSIPQETWVLGDHLLARAVSNLLSNAAEHTEGVARIRVTADVEADAVTLRIADDGPGVPESVRGSLFERTDGDHGLGLYLVRTIVERYDGSISLEETGPEGSTFAVELPRASSEGARAEATTPSSL